MPCSLCGSTKNLKYCSGCKKIQYCSTSCQKNDWKKHKKICKVASIISKADLNSQYEKASDLFDNHKSEESQFSNISAMNLNKYI